MDNKPTKFTVNLTSDENKKFNRIREELDLPTQAKTFKTLLDIYDRYQNLIEEKKNFTTKYQTLEQSYKNLQREIEKVKEYFKHIQNFFTN